MALAVVLKQRFMPPGARYNHDLVLSQLAEGVEEVFNVGTPCN